MVAALASPDAYPRPTAGVETIETHRSWVFLTDDRAWKLKKPQRHDGADLTTVEARGRACRREVVLNRRLAPKIYLGTVPVVRAEGGGLRLGLDGEIVDWLVEMVRLPRERMLDERIRCGSLRPEEVDALGRRLVRFYRESPPLVVGPPSVRRRTWRELRLSLALTGFPDGEDGDARGLVRAIAAAVEAEREPLAARAAGGRIVEGHGDLRPEHVAVLDEPVVIDALDFSRELRLVDPVQELVGLDLECRLLGAARVGERLLALYGEEVGDSCPAGLIALYGALHALVRARLAFAHLLEPDVADPQRWHARARSYLELGAATVCDGPADRSSR